MPNPNNLNAGSHRFGFNGKEVDGEVSGNGNSYDYGFRIYNPRLGRFLSVDPLARQFPFYSPYHFAGNKPIAALDIDGLEDIYFMETVPNGEAAIELLNATTIGKGIIDAFKNVNPNNGPVNTGWDVLIIKGEFKQEIGYYHKGQNSFILEAGDNDISPIKGKVNFIPTLQAFLDARLVGEENVIRKTLIETYGEELVLNTDKEMLERIIENDRGLIIIKIVENPLEETAKDIAHEIGAHATNTAIGVEKSESQEHLEYNGKFSPITQVMPGSIAWNLAAQIAVAIKTFNHTGNNTGGADPSGGKGKIGDINSSATKGGGKIKDLKKIR